MTNQAKNILKKELWLDSNLEKCYMQSEKYMDEIDHLMHNVELNGERKQAEWFKKMFGFYTGNLIPALEERIDLDQRHADLMTDNPDKVFKPFRVEIRQHQKLIHQFLHRFDQVVRDYQKFIENQPIGGNNNENNHNNVFYNNHNE